MSLFDEEAAREYLEAREQKKPYFIHHAYDCELIENELRPIQEKLKSDFSVLIADLAHFKEFVQKLV